MHSLTNSLCILSLSLSVLSFFSWSSALTFLLFSNFLCVGGKLLLITYYLLIYYLHVYFANIIFVNLFSYLVYANASSILLRQAASQDLDNLKFSINNGGKKKVFLIYFLLQILG